MAGTISGADIYGIASPMYSFPDPTVGGNQSMVAPAFGTSTAAGIDGSQSPTISIIGMIALLLALRVAIELSDRA